MMAKSIQGAVGTAILFWVCATQQLAASEELQQEKLEFFERKIRPLLVDHCYTCHSANTKPSGELRVDDRNGLFMGGNSGAAVVPGQPEKSLLLRRVTQAEGKRRMPLESERLSDAQVADLRRWIAEGAVWPAEAVPESLGKSNAEYEGLKATHWAWQPFASPPVPEVRNRAWPKDDIDRFVLAQLEQQKLAPVGDASKQALIRRVTFDLTGLPPTPAAIEAFLANNAADALTKVVDQLLASPQFGERWGRHWLDVARYGESTGPSRNIPYPYAWRYRDYVIDALNADLPFDRFVTEQIAGDLLPADSDAEHDRLVTATGFLALGVKDVNQRFKVRFLMDNVDEQIDVVSRSLLGLTVSCARCHDHKFDPVPTTDYYALAGIFTSTDNCAGVRNKMGGGGLDYYDTSMLLTLSHDIPAAPEEQVKQLTAEFEQARQQWDAIRGTPEGVAKGPDGLPVQRKFRLKFEKARADLLALTDPAARGYAVHGVREAKVIADTQVRIRGEAERLGPTVPRGVLSAVVVPDAPAIAAAHSGRLELAQWLTSPSNPLVPRVIVNRIWHHLFSRGIVTTVDNFGMTGDKPSHPELLNHLAARFVRDGWSTKRLVRAIVLSRAYQLSTEATPAHLAVDPANKFIWRHSPRRLDAEEIRDAILASSGSLQLGRPGPSAAKELRMVEMRDNGPEARVLGQAADKYLHRSVYLPLLRGVTPRALEAFDPVDQTLVSGKRDTTTVPSQSLYLLNATFIRQQSLALAERLLKADSLTDPDRITLAYEVLFGRGPSVSELARARAFLSDYESAYREQPASSVAAPAEAVVVAEATTDSPAKPPIVDPDQVDQSGAPLVEEVVIPSNPQAAAWLALVQAFYASAEFRHVN
jgi:cytochrome c553